MKLRRILFLMIVFLVAVAGTALANTAYDTYRAKKMALTFNGKTVSYGALAVQTKGNDIPMISLQDAAEMFGGYYSVDEESGKINYHKPNVQLFFMWKEAGNQGKDFGINHTVTSNTDLQISITAIVDSVFGKIDEVQFVILDPSGNEVLKQNEKVSLIKKILKKDVISKLNKENVSYIPLASNPENFKFKETGLYKVQFFVKPEGEKQFYLVDQAIVESVE